LTIETTDIKHVYSGDGVTTHWPYTFPILEGTDVKVMITSAAGIHTILDDDYTVDTENERVVYPDPGDPLPDDGSTITVYRSRPQLQETIFTDGGPFPASSFEDSLDSLTMNVQELSEGLSRAIKYTIDQTPTEEETTAIVESSADAAASAAAAAVSALAAAASAASIATPIPIASGGTNSTTVLVNGKFMQSSGGKIVESSVEAISVLPAGSSMDYCGASIPAGWLLCDGSAVSRSAYANLFSAIGTIWGIGDGTTTFNVPNFSRRTSVGSGGSGTGTLGNTIGNVGGAETHTLTTTEMPAHAHSVNGNTSLSVNSGGSTQSLQTAFGTYSTSSEGGGTAHNNMQPSAVVNKIIKT